MSKRIRRSFHKAMKFMRLVENRGDELDEDRDEDDFQAAGESKVEVEQENQKVQPEEKAEEDYGFGVPDYEKATIQMSQSLSEKLRRLPILRKRASSIAEAMEIFEAILPTLKITNPSCVVTLEAVIHGLNKIADRLVAVGDKGDNERTRVLNEALLFALSQGDAKRIEHYVETLKAVMEDISFNLDGVEEEMEKLEQVLERNEEDDGKFDKDELLSNLTVIAKKAEQYIEKEAKALSSAIQAARRDNNVNTGPGVFRRVEVRLNDFGLAALTELERDISTIDPASVKVGESINTGTFGEVLYATWDGKEVAVKRVLRRGGLPLDMRHELSLEAQTWVQLKHPHIVELHGTCIIDRDLYLVMELCEMSLHALLHDYPGANLFDDDDEGEFALSVDEVTRFMYGMFSGLRFLHEDHKIIHRDVKPLNLLISKGQIKLADFGLSVLKNGATHEGGNDTFNIHGTPPYLPPEVLQTHSRWSFGADIYSAGIVTWEMMERRTPFLESGIGGIMAIASVVHEGNRPLFTRVSEHYPEWMKKVARKCWDEDPRNRPSARRIMEFLEEKIQERGPVHEFISGKSGESNATLTLGSANSAAMASSSILVNSLAAGKIGGITDEKVKSLMEALKRDSPRPSALHQLDLRCHSAKKRAETCGEIMKFDGGLDVLGALFQRFSDDQPNLLSLVTVIFHLSEENFQMDLASNLSIKTSLCRLVHSLAEKHETNMTATQLMRSTCNAVNSICLNSEAREILLDVGILKSIQLAVSTHLDDPVPLRDILRAYATIALEASPQTMEQLLDPSALQNVTEALIDHLGDPEVMSRALEWVANATANLRTPNAYIKEHTKPAVFDAMEHHTEHEGVQAHGSLAMRNFFDSAPFDETTKVRAIDVIIEGMEFHSDVVDVQENGLAALGKLLDTTSVKAYMVENFQSKVVINAMKEHPMEEGIQTKGCLVLLRLAEGPQEAVTELVMEGAPHTLDTALQNFPMNKSIKLLVQSAKKALEQGRN